MAYENLITTYDTEEQARICREMARRWRRGDQLFLQKLNARTPQEVTAINQELVSLKNDILPDTITLLDNEA